MTAKLSGMVGRKFCNKYGEEVTVVGYQGAYDVEVLFPNGFKISKRLVHLKSGKFTSPYTKTFSTTGFIGEGKFCKKNCEKPFAVWEAMIGRCYGEELRKVNPTYSDCTVDSSWFNFQTYAKWYTENPFFQVGWEVDKDILSKEKKIYSEDTCAFVPPEINSFFLTQAGSRGLYPIGVYLTKGKFAARCKVGVKHAEWLGLFDTPQEAFLAYKKRKEAYAKELASRFIGRVHEGVYNTLINFTVSEDD